MLGLHGRSITRAIFTPPARLLARLGVTPNMVTAAGTVLTVVVACTTIARGHLAVGGILLGVLLFIDSLDGVLARLTHRVTPFGAFFDSTLDRLGDGAVFGSLLYWAVVGMPDGAVRQVSIVAGLVALVGVGTVPYARARAQSMGVDAKVGIAERTDRLVVALVAAGITDWGVPLWFYAAGLSWVAFASLVTVGQRVWAARRALAGRAAA